MNDGGGGGGYDYGEGTVSNISDPVYGADEGYEFEVTEAYDETASGGALEGGQVSGLSRGEASGILRWGGTAISVATLFIPATAPIRGAIYVFRGAIAPGRI